MSRTTNKFSLFDFCKKQADKSMVKKPLMKRVTSFLSLNKQHFLLMFILCSSSVCKAQSPELKAAYNQVVSTLKEYKFKSLEVYDNGADYASTRSITIKMQGGNIIVTFTDNFGAFSDPFFGNKQGTKTIKVSIKDAKIQLGRWNDNKIMFSSENGVEFTYKGKKELLEEYAICGEKLSCKKLLGELTTMLTLAQEEEFNGSLGVVTQNKSTSSKTKQNNAQINSLFFIFPPQSTHLAYSF